MKEFSSELFKPIYVDVLPFSRSLIRAVIRTRTSFIKWTYLSLIPKQKCCVTFFLFNCLISIKRLKMNLTSLPERQQKADGNNNSNTVPIARKFRSAFDP